MPAIEHEHEWSGSTALVCGGQCGRDEQQRLHEGAMMSSSAPNARAYGEPLQGQKMAAQNGSAAPVEQHWRGREDAGLF